MKITLGKTEYETTTPKTMARRFTAVIWGPSGVGKTTLAATAERPTFVINWDPDGPSSIPEFDDIHILDLAAEPDSIVEKFKDPDFLRKIIGQAVEQVPDLRTVLFDSTTTFGDKAFAYGVKHAESQRKKGDAITLEDPGYKGYGRKNVWSLFAMKSLSEVTAEFGLNSIAIAHEDTPTKDTKTGEILFTTMMVGGNIAEKMPVRINECWYMFENSKKQKRILVRQGRGKKPMKTRMFDTRNEIEFTWKFDPITWEGMKIEDWMEEWRELKGAKMELPK